MAEREMVALLDAAEALIQERENPAPDYTYRAMLYNRLKVAARSARQALEQSDAPPNNGDAP